MIEEEDARQPYLPWAIFDELRDEKNCRYWDVATWSRMRARILEKRAERVETPDPTLAGLQRAVERSRFGDVLAYLVREKIIASAVPGVFPWLHTILKTQYVFLNGHAELQEGLYHLPFLIQSDKI